MQLKQNNFDTLLKALIIGLLALVLFSCKSKQKTVRKEVASLEQLETKEVEVSKIQTSDTQQLISVKDSVTQSEVKNATLKQTETTTTLSPVDPTKPSQAKVNGKTYNWQNAIIKEQEKDKTTASNSEKNEVKSKSETTMVQDKTTTQVKAEEKATKSNVEKSASSEKYKKVKGFATGIVIWPLIVFIVVFGLIAILTGRNPFLIFINLFKRDKK